MPENYFRLLGLTFDPPETDTAIINAAIEKKRSDWSQSALISPNPQKFNLLIKSLDEIKKVMLDSDSRANHVNEVKKIEYAELDTYIALLSVKGFIERKEIEDLSKKFGFSKSTIEKRITVKIEENRGSKKSELKPEPDSSKMKEVEDNLKNFNQVHSENPPVNTLYEFMVYITNDPELKVASADELRKNAEAKNLEYQRRGINSDENIIIKNLTSQCRVLFTNENEKKKYDNYLETQKLRGITDQIDKLAGISDNNLINGEIVLGFIKQLSEVLSSSEDAVRTYTDYCKKKKYPIVLPSNEIRQQINQCFFCGVAYISDKTAVTCTKCGNPLVMSCPKCNTINDHSNNNCKKCAFEISKMRLVDGLCEFADKALERMDFDAADSKLKKANEYWPGNDRVKKITENLTILRNRCEEKVRGLREKISDKCYYGAYAELKKIQQTVPGYSDTVIENEITEHIKSAEEWIKKARSSKEEVNIIDFCTKAYQECKDHPEITTLLKQYPVAPPTSLSYSTDTVNCTNTLTWIGSTSVGSIIYRIIRKRDTLPLTPTDGELIQDERSCQFVDKKIEPGIRYFYSVFSIRAGIFSSSLSTNNAVINYAEVSNVSISSESRKITANWKVPNNSHSVGIWRKLNSEPKMAQDGISVGNISKGGFSDSSVENDVTYGYIICVKYSDGKKEVWSPGFRFSATPTQPPEPVEIQSITKINGDTYEATWAPTSHGQVCFYLTKNYEPRAGTIISEDELTRQFTMIPLLSHTSASARFSLIDFVNNIVPVIRTANSAVVGISKRVSKVGSVGNISGRIYNGSRVLIEFEWPEQINKVCCLYRNDRFPTDINDPDAVKIICTKNQYEKENAINFRYVEEKTYFISIFSIYVQNNEEVYSDAVNYSLKGSKKSSISYDISLSKSLFSKKYSGSITVDSNSSVWQLPQIVLIGRDRVAPMQKDQGTTLATIPAGALSNKNKRYDFNIEGATQDMRIKLFFQKNEDYQDYTLIAKYPEKLRIN